MSDSGFEAFTILLSMIVCFMIMTKQCTYNVWLYFFFPREREAKGHHFCEDGRKGEHEIFRVCFSSLASLASDQARGGRNLLAFLLFGLNGFLLFCCVGKFGLDVWRISFTPC
ncbi:hypothetical protein CORC01_08645 [Colletotrichum orchidophilum]|uniref:Uncharacterized protein n=1 Tax=Colletotrichum orchidophilum TaxID=1209926 RepID=A0A1G4B3V6_9PEZI|nr:uncharacterized protein CORC01_08645 [Colletotrichum orchidophilum]OHE96108.1 hypothetical protein CORC01_08645 [Colletotrichum orchidophilum]